MQPRGFSAGNVSLKSQLRAIKVDTSAGGPSPKTAQDDRVSLESRVERQIRTEPGGEEEEGGVMYNIHHEAHPALFER
jgi:hypothetical protein